MIPTPEDCHKDACVDNDQQFSRILRRWAAQPLGQFSERDSNHERLRSAIEYRMFGPVLDRSPDSTLHEFWSDGVEFVEWQVSENCYYFGGTCYYSDGEARCQWLAPFELRIEYEKQNLDYPASVDLRFGHRDPANRISKQYPAGREFRLYALAHSLYGARPTTLADWAAHVNLSPYRVSPCAE
jgi:hypothetical protein